jgi:hypothetical protein
MRRLFVSLFILCGVFAPLPFSLGAQTGTPCNVYGSGSTPPAGYGAAWNPLTSARELLLSASCISGGAAVSYTVGVNTQTHYIYKLGYYYSGSWKPFTMTGTFASGSTDWLLGKGTYTHNTPPSTDYFWVGYVCQYINSAWKCGCRDSACATPMWQLQQVKYPASGGTTSGGTTGGTTGGGWYHTVPNSWDTPIPAGHPTLAPWPSSNVESETCTSAEFVDEYIQGTGGRLYLNIENGWSVVYWDAAASDPTYTVGVYPPDHQKAIDTMAGAKAEGWDVLKIPRNAYPEAHGLPEYRDRWTAVFSPDKSYVTSFFRAMRTDSGGVTKWSAQSVRAWPKNSKGYLDVYDRKGSIGLCPRSPAHGTIMYDHVTKDHEIPHALAFAYSSPADNKVPGRPNSMYPCKLPYAFDMPDPPGGARKCAMPTGIRLQYDPSANPAQVCAGEEAQYRNTCIVIVKALQKYGMILVDRGNSAFAESLKRHPTKKWSDHAASGYALPDYGDKILRGLDLRKFRAVEPVRP